MPTKRGAVDFVASGRHFAGRHFAVGTNGEQQTEKDTVALVPEGRCWWNLRRATNRRGGDNNPTCSVLKISFRSAAHSVVRRIFTDAQK